MTFSLYDTVAERVGDVALPSKPHSLLGEYNFPEDPTALSTDEVGKWMFTLTAWQGYVLRELTLVDLAAADAKSVYEEGLRQSLAKTPRKSSYQSQQSLITEVLALDGELSKKKQRLDIEAAAVDFWQHLQRIYEAQVAVLSREISRRSTMEARER